MQSFIHTQIKYFIRNTKRRIENFWDRKISIFIFIKFSMKILRSNFRKFSISEFSEIFIENCMKMKIENFRSQKCSVFLCFGWNILFEFFIKLFNFFTKNYSFDERVTLSTKLKTFATGILSGIIFLHSGVTGNKIATSSVRLATWAVSRNWSAFFLFVVDVEIKNFLECHFCVYLSPVHYLDVSILCIRSAAKFYIDP